MSRAAIFAAAATFVFTATAAHAAIIEYAFTGVVTEVVQNENHLILGGLQSGDTFSGSLIIDASVDGGGEVNPAGFASYHQTARFQLNLGFMSTTVVNERAYIRVHDDAVDLQIRPLGWSNYYDGDVFSYGFDSLTAIEDDQGWALYEMGIWLVDSTQTWLTGYDLPLLDLIEVDLAPFDVFGYRRISDSIIPFEATGELTSLTLIPEPTNAALLLIMAACCVARRR